MAERIIRKPKKNLTFVLAFEAKSEWTDRYTDWFLILIFMFDLIFKLTFAFYFFQF